MTLLNRLGNKRAIALKIQEHFYPHKKYIELFFGAGGMFFNKTKSKFNILNDNDSDVYNLYNVLMKKKDEFIEEFMNTPIHQDLWNYYKKNKEDDPVKKAVRFISCRNTDILGNRILWFLR